MKKTIITLMCCLLLFGCNNKEKEEIENENKIIGYWKAIIYYEVDDESIEERVLPDNYYLKIENNNITYITVTVNDLQEITYSYTLSNNKLHLNVNDEDSNGDLEYGFNYLDNIINNKILLTTSKEEINFTDIYVQITEEEFNKIIGGDINE